RPRPTDLPGRGRDARARVLPRRRRSRGEAGVGGVPGPATGRSARGGLSRHVGAQRHGRGGGRGRRAGALHRSARPSHPSCGEGQGRQEEEAVRRLVVAGLVLACACSRSAADHEELGDRAYAAATALQGLRAVWPSRPLGKYTRLAALDAAERGDTAAALALLPSAVAAAGSGRTADSLLFVYGMAAVRAHACSTAVPAFESVIRRQREPAIAEGAREGLGLCALIEGQRLLAAGKPADAEDWFRRASAPGSPP